MNAASAEPGLTPTLSPSFPASCSTFLPSSPSFSGCPLVRIGCPVRRSVRSPSFLRTKTPTARSAVPPALRLPFLRRPRINGLCRSGSATRACWRGRSAAERVGSDPPARQPREAVQDLVCSELEGAVHTPFSPRRPACCRPRPDLTECDLSILRPRSRGSKNLSRTRNSHSLSLSVCRRTTSSG